MNTFRPISPTTIQLSSIPGSIPNHTIGGTLDRFAESKDQKIKSVSPGPNTYDIRLLSYERSSSRSPIYPYETVSSPKMYKETLPSTLIPKAQAPPVGTYEIQRWGSPSNVPSPYLSDKNTSSFTNKSRLQALGSSTCHGESKFFNESKWDEKFRAYSPGPGSYDVSPTWTKRKSLSTSSSSPTSITGRLSSPIPKSSSNSKPWNDYKQQQEKQQHNSLLDSPKTTNLRKTKSELLEIKSEIESVKRLPNIYYL